MRSALALLVAIASASALAGADTLRSELVFPPRQDHNHAASIVECPDGGFLVSWYRGSGERQADDVAVYGARRAKGSEAWSEAFVMADTPGFPDGNTAMFIDAKSRLWLFWPVVIANTWESCLTQFLVSSDFQGSGAPRWERQGTIYLKPLDFAAVMHERLAARLAQSPGIPLPEDRLQEFRKRIDDKLSQRLGWQPRCKPTVLPSGRIVLPLYSDTYSVSLMALSDDGGETWTASRPLAGFGSIQPAVLRREDGSLCAYLRENGPLDRVRICESTDDGVTWGPVGVTELPNPGSGLDGVRLASGRWLLVYNDTTEGRRSLAVSLSDDEGKSWKHTRHLERREDGAYHYPAVIQARDGTIHVVYSHFVREGKSVRHAAFPEDWVIAGE